MAQNNLFDSLMLDEDSVFKNNIVNSNTVDHVNFLSDQNTPECSMRARYEQRVQSDQSQNINSRPLYYQPSYNSQQTNQPIQNNTYCLNQNSTPLEPNYVNSNMRIRPVPIGQWGIVFSGDEFGLSVNDFISQLEMRAMGQRVDVEYLMADFSQVLQGPAKVWYRAFYKNIHSWFELKSQLRLQFLPPDYDFLLKREIEDRLQGANETFNVYLASMEMLFSSMSEPLTELAKLPILIRNLHLFYLEKIQDRSINSIEQLSSFCRSLEITKSIVERRQTGSVPVMEPAFAAPFVPARHNEVFAIEQPTEQVKVCWNCQKSGHRFQDCRNSRKNIFCYRCGAVGTITRYCKRCSGNESSRSNRQ